MSSLSTFKFDPKLTAAIEELKENLGASSKSEVLRRAITLLKLVQQANDRGEELLLVKDNEQKRIVIT